MGLLNLLGLKIESSNQYAKEIELEKDYGFMYENFIFSSQRNLYLFLEENNGIIEALKFEFKIYKYGYPNDEVGLPSKILGVEIYGISQVFNSDWIKELMINNRSHSKHSDNFYSNFNHYIVRFKDVTLEVISQNYEIVKITKEEFNIIIDKELEYIKNAG
jgi:hypothetical protein